MLKAGFSRMDVTPPFGNDLSGYYERRLADGILDPLYLNTVAVSNENETLILMAIDYIGIKLDQNIKLRELISEKTGVAVDHILIAALHQHTSPCLAAPATRDTALQDSVYIDVLYRKFADAAKMAMDDMKEATLSTAAMETAEPIAFVRRYFSKEQGVVTNPGSQFTLLGRCAEADNTMRLVRFQREGANDIAIVNFSTHPDVIGGTKWSADWPGFTRKFVESDLENVSCLFFTGCQGDSNHIDFFKPKEERLHGTRYEHSEYMGRTVADAVKAAWTQTKAVTGEAIFAQNRVIYNLTNVEGAEKYDECVAWVNDYKAKLKPSGSYTMAERAFAYRVSGLREQPIFRPVPLTVMGIGDLVFVAFGGEAFTSYGEATRALAPEKFVMNIVCANGYEGYFPTAEAFKQGGYEAASSFFMPTLQDEIMAALTEMFGQIEK